jgi:tRNA(Ile)-lysidine synthase
MSVIDRVRQFVRERALFDRETRVLAAVSGGSDSVALAHLLRDLDAAGDVRLVGLVHFNHQLRASALDDEQFTTAVAASLDRPIVTAGEDVRARARRERRSIEDAARAARYECFARARASLAADLVALGHTRDDQAETVLLRLTRGAGPRGLAAMHPRNGRIVRPLLGCRRQDLRAWLAQRQIAFVEDETNDDVSIPRNRVRAELLPLLEARFNPAIVDVLADEAEIARGLWEWMDATTASLAAQLVRSPIAPADAPVREIDIAELTAAPVALQRALLWRVVSELAPRRPITFGHIEAVRRLSEDGDALDAPGQRVQRIGRRIVLTGRAADVVGRPAVAAANLFRVSLSIPGEVVVPQTGCRVSAESLSADSERPDGRAGSDCRSVVHVRGDLVAGSLAVRNRRPGDSFRPVGLGGRKKLQDFFVDRKVPRGERDAVPLVVDETDRIVWVAGFGIDEAFRVTDPAQAVIILKLKALGGSA